MSSRGTIDFPGQRILEQDFYHSNEQLRDTDVFIRSLECGSNLTVKAKLIDPYAFLVRHESSRFTYVARDRIEFNREPFMDGMVLSVRFEDTSTARAKMTYLTRSLWWTPRYEVIVIDDECKCVPFRISLTELVFIAVAASLRALADIHNEHERSYSITASQLITGTVPLAATSSKPAPSLDNLRAEFMAGSMGDFSSPIAARPDSTNFGTYSYSIARQYNLLAKSIKTFPFLSAIIGCNYTLEAATYLASGISTGQFQRLFTIQPTEFLPAGTITFYMAASGLTLGQGRLPDTSSKSEQKVSLGNDPDMKFTVASMITATRQIPAYGQDVNVNITLSNRKDKQTVAVTLSLNSGYRNTTVTIKYRSSSSITISQDPNNRAMLIIRAVIKANQEETCMCSLKQSN